MTLTPGEFAKRGRESALAASDEDKPAVDLPPQEADNNTTNADVVTDEEIEQWSQVATQGGVWQTMLWNDIFYTVATCPRVLSRIEKEHYFSMFQNIITRKIACPACIQNWRNVEVHNLKQNMSTQRDILHFFVGLRNKHRAAQGKPKRTVREVMQYYDFTDIAISLSNHMKLKESLVHGDDTLAPAKAPKKASKSASTASNIIGMLVFLVIVVAVAIVTYKMLQTGGSKPNVSTRIKRGTRGKGANNPLDALA
jgi:hypothetical protein